jgi:hypothetical protein
MVKVNLIREVSNEISLSCLNEIENSYRLNTSVNLNIKHSSPSKFKSLLLKLASKFNKWNIFNIFSSTDNRIINISYLMGATFSSLVPHFLFTSNNFVYIYDAWPSTHQIIGKYGKLLKIKIIFFSSNKITLLFNQLNTGIRAIWIPEGIDAYYYYYASYSNKNIDVLEFGRRYDHYHNSIKQHLAINNKVHLFEQYKGKVIFESNSDFLEGLSKSKISICIPSNITHPDRAEKISSMTLRYLQSMASKCLIVGIMPEEMHELFDYIPIVEIDMENAGNQILSILNNYESYIPLIEKNYNVVKQSHTWSVRNNKILEIIKNERNY